MHADLGRRACAFAIVGFTASGRLGTHDADDLMSPSGPAAPGHIADRKTAYSARHDGDPALLRDGVGAALLHGHRHVQSSALFEGVSERLARHHDLVATT